MIAKYFLWVYLCAGPNCHCERVTFGASDGQLYLKTSCTELLLTKVDQNKEYFIMQQDTSFFAVRGEKGKSGMIVFINHLNRSNRVVKTISIEYNGRCKPGDL